MLFSDSIGITIIEPINVEHDFIDSLFCSERFFNLFKCNISNPNLQKLDDIMYFFRKNEGIEEAFVKGKFQQIFKNNKDDLFDIIWNNPNLRTDILGSIPPNISPAFRLQKKQDFENIINSKGDRLFKFIKIK